MLSKGRYSTNIKFNLFSAMKLLMNGWDLGGDRNAIWLRNIERTVKFDIKIKTKEGIIFAMYTN